MNTYNQKINLSTSDSLYICIPTYHNTINLYPYAEIKRRTEGQVYTLLFSSNMAKEKGWENALTQLLSNCSSIELDEKQSLQILQKFVALTILQQYEITGNPQIFINYGGGLKHFGYALWQISKEIPNAKCTMIYPDKGLHKMIWNKVENSIVTGEEISSLDLNFESDDVISLFSQYTIEKELVFNALDPQKIDHNLKARLDQLVNIYQSEEITDLIYTTASNSDTTELENTDVLTLLEKLDGRNKEKDSELIERLRKNIIEKFNTAHSSLELNGNMDLNLKVDPYDKQEFRQLPNKLKSYFTDINNYVKNVKGFNVTHKLSDDLTKLKLNNPFNATGNQILEENLIDKIFNNTHLQIKGHSRYFELITLKHVLAWAEANNTNVNEVAFDFKVKKQNPTNNSPSNQAQIDVMVYTKEGTIIYIECKTYKYSQKDFLASYTRAQEYGGVFNEYIIVLPPLPSTSSPELRTKYETIFTSYNNLVEKNKNVKICQLYPENRTKEIFDSLEDTLSKIK